MPVNIPRDLPARAILEGEGIFVMSDERARSQDIRPMRIAILNLMPTKEATETQLLRVLGSTPLQVEVTLLHMASHSSRNTAPEHLEAFYATFADIADQYFDGLIVTGAPIERLNFEDVDYWPEMTQILDWSREHVYSTIHICWGAQAALYRHYGVPKYELPRKLFGVFDHQVLRPESALLRGFDERFHAPHSRHTDIHAADIEATGQVDLLAVSADAGVLLAATPDLRQVFVTGHPEYDRDTLAREYRRDVETGQPIDVPAHYYPGDDPAAEPIVNWRSHGVLLYANWLNHCVYQRVPFESQNSAP
ncbi:homoserine O-succinyltransferase [Gordonia effusa NBRC 100432]|uniref:Homoserine O-acetyltransferase n=1 Tax=Gordonia effusa NBRC 100432 TaxID=1077974 RepID=H0R1B4_9ACTN|nr:homoserine O-succinyltransferase [Gordonia effusa]GAB18865.1 homoserine O-succinyltransferase [Gordonia effusa NBRC 100432]